jgi:hypothetical protein
MRASPSPFRRRQLDAKDAASVRRIRPFRDRQPQAGAAGIARPRLVHPVKPVENFDLMLRRNSGSAVRHLELDEARFLFQTLTEIDPPMGECFTAL